MGFMTTFKANRAYRAHAAGNLEAAKAGYAAAFAEGLNNPKLLLAYAMLLLRAGDYERAAEVLRKADKAPGVLPDQKNQIIAHYAIAIWKLGRLDKAVELLQALFRKGKTGFLYGALGFLLIEQGDAEAALAFNREAVAYDDEDPVCLDNLAQTYDRLLNDKESARPYFERALKFKPGAIDSNYFLAQYDVEEGKPADAVAKLEVAVAGRFSPMNYATPAQIQAQLDALKARTPGEG
jgi:tetratricopeptide (TPR) repeat protein